MSGRDGHQYRITNSRPDDRLGRRRTRFTLFIIRVRPRTGYRVARGAPPPALSKTGFSCRTIFSSPFPTRLFPAGPSVGFVRARARVGFSGFYSVLKYFFPRLKRKTRAENEMPARDLIDARRKAHANKTRRDSAHAGNRVSRRPSRIAFRSPF